MLYCFMILVILALAFVWIITFPYNFRQYLNNFLSLRSIMVIVLGVVLIYQLSGKTVKQDFSSNPLLLYSGFIMQAMGAGIAIWAKYTMKESWGVPGQHDIKKQKKLVTSGPYKYCRNPIYTGLILVYTGTEIAIGSPMILLVIPIYILIYKSVKKEEELLQKYFGEEYIKYKETTGRFL